MKNFSTVYAIRWVVVALFSAVVGGTWDVWWHAMAGRENFLAPPHILLYIGVAVAFITAFYGWHKTKEKIWRTLSLFLCAMPGAFVLDLLWHEIFGIEVVSSSLIFWSPPHVLIILSTVASFLVLLPFLRKEEDKAVRYLFEALCFAGVFLSLSFLTRPFSPLGPYHVLGFWGAGFPAGLFALTVLCLKRWMPGPGTAFLFSSFVCLVASIVFGETTTANTLVPPQAYPPSWLQVFSLVIPAFAADLLVHKIPLWLKGGIVGTLNSGIMYIFASYFIEPAFRYGITETVLAVLAGFVGGIIAAALAPLLVKKAG